MVTNPFGQIAAGDEDPSSRVLRPASRLGRYELLTRVGRGGMASVWAARQHGERGFTKAVSVKTILPHLACEVEFETLFLREARIAATIRHPNVCEVYDLGEDAGTLYMAMEWINGDSLSALLHARPSGGPIHWPLAARIVADACAGLHAAHTTRDSQGNWMGILHRDISPQNILVSQDGIVKVADFGIAKASMSLSAMTRSGFLRGKLAYSSPERISGAAYDRRADVYALGCVLYELVSGEPPFVGDDDVKLLVEITSGRPRSIPSSLDLPAPLVALIERAINPDPDERAQSADELRVALETLLFERKRLVSADQVAALVRTRLGAALAVRQRTIHATLERLSNLSPSSTASVAPSTVRSHAAPSFAPSSESHPCAPPGPPSQAPQSGPTPSSWAMASQQASPAGFTVLTPPLIRETDGLPPRRRSGAGRAFTVAGLVAALLIVIGAGVAALPRLSSASWFAQREPAAQLPPPTVEAPLPGPAEIPVVLLAPVAPLPPVATVRDAGTARSAVAARPKTAHKPEAPDDPLSLGLPAVPAEPPAVSAPSNPY